MDNTKIEIISNYNKSILKYIQKPSPVEFQQMIDEYFFDLIDNKKENIMFGKPIC